MTETEELTFKFHATGSFTVEVVAGSEEEAREKLRGAVDESIEISDVAFDADDPVLLGTST